MEHRLIRSDDVEATVALMDRIGVHFAGSRSPRVRTAVARDAVSDPREAIVALAVDGGAPCALVVAFTNRARYWRRFAARHPRAALDIAVHRIERRLRRRFWRPRSGSGDDVRLASTRDAFGDRLGSTGRERWEDDSDQIAKVMYVAVDPDHRQGGVGTALYRWFFRSLAARGISRCDAEVSEGNLAAATLHRRFPFRVNAVRGGYFLSLATAEVT